MCILIVCLTLLIFTWCQRRMKS
ncbi:type I toxin-antitoxin system Hok family toxin, partial [Escherichia coli]